MKGRFSVVFPTGLCAGSILALLLLIHEARLPESTLFWRAIGNFAHAPIFGLIALASFALAGSLGAASTRRRLLFAITMVAVAAVVSEGAQVAGSRDASLVDLVVDLGGAAAFLLVLCAFKASGTDLGAHRRRILFAAGVAILSIVAIPVSVTAVGMTYRDQIFPRLLGPSRLQFPYLAGNGAVVSVDTHATTPRLHVLLAKFDHPGISLVEPVADWSRFENLVLDLGVPEGQPPLELTLRIHDRWHDMTYADRFNDRITLDSPISQARIPIRRLREGPDGRKMDMSAIAGLMIYGSRETIGREFYVYGIRLDEDPG